MKKIFTFLFFTFLLLSFCVKKPEENNSNYTLASVREVYIDRGSETENETDKSDYEQGDGERIENFIGVFPKKNDTVSIYKLNDDLTEIQENFLFWSRKKLVKNNVIFYSSNKESIKLTFGNKNNIFVNNDVYSVNLEYYNFLKQKILNEQSILDLAFFLKDGYGDYAQTLEPLNKNWRNQKENKIHKIICAKIKNKDNQTNNQFFHYKINYKYRNDGILESISGENRFNKKFVSENVRQIEYEISNGENERSFVKEYIYKNKETLLDSIVGSAEQYSISKTSYYTKYQSLLKFKTVNRKPNNVQDILMLLN